MRKKLTALSITFILVLLEISAADFILSPWQGGFGLNMASTRYDFPSGTSPIDYALTDTTGSTGERSVYTDAEIIGIVGVHNIDTRNNEYDPKGMTITAHCDGGFYFTSRSNPDAKRPFEIKLVLKRSNVGSAGITSNTDFDEGYSY